MPGRLGPRMVLVAMKGEQVEMKGQGTKEDQVQWLALKSRQWSAARRRHEALIQAEVRRLARSDRRRTTPLRDSPMVDRDAPPPPAA